MSNEERKIIAGHQPHYLPWIGYFNKIYLSDRFCFVDSIQYNKKQFQNRTKILTKNGPIWLTVPVKTKGKFYQKIKDVEINNDITWKKKHWKSIELAYSKAPYFHLYRDFFEDLYKKDWRTLSELNEYTIKNILDFLGIKKETIRSSEIKAEGKKTDLLIDICKKSNSIGYLSGGGAARDYVELDRFKEVELEHYFQKFSHPQYKQINSKTFVSNLSVIDLLFNLGPKSLELIIKSGFKEK